MNTQVIGADQDKLKKFLQDRINGGDLAHAYLFVGHEWSGADALIDWMIVQLGQTDVKPLIPRPSKNSARLAIRIDYIRDLKKQLSSSLSDWRVVTIREMGLLEEDSANALLKVLEEPPARTVFLLNATRADAVLPTIMSRCQIMRLAYPSPETVKQMLVQQADRATELAAYLNAPLYAQIMACQKLNEQDALLLEFLLRETMVNTESSEMRQRATQWLHGLAAARRAIAYYIPPAIAYELIWI